MSIARNWYADLLKQLRLSYMRAYAVSAKLGYLPIEHADAITKALKAQVSFADLLISSGLRKKATGESVVTRAGLTMKALEHRNPWFKNHRVETSPLIDARIKELVAAETKHLDTMKRLRNFQPNKQHALARAEMLYRHATSAISNVSEAVALSVPEIGAAFPVGEYLTRDDRRVRPMHKAMYGFLAARENDVWAVIRPPNGFNCRCYIRWLTRPECKRRHITDLQIRWPNSASERNFKALLFPDDGWRGPKIVSA